mmetsp:Transcript_105602/g.303740  ORF Transcript_105602/g.303740 Transcript_105602/m.303740 type:complete len:91 (+) Transcript_105602:437-709(+)
METHIAIKIWPMATRNALFQRNTKKETAKRESRLYRGGAQRQHFVTPPSTAHTLSFQTEPIGHLSVHLPGIPVWLHSDPNSKKEQVGAVP